MTLPRQCELGRLFFTALSATVLVLGPPTAIALAHASLVRSDPAGGARLQQSPSRIVAWFDQELDASASTIRVDDAQGNALEGDTGGVDLADPDHASMIVTLPQTLEPGRYLVRWTAVSADGNDAHHSTKGEFTFEIGN